MVKIAGAERRAGVANEQVGIAIGWTAAALPKLSELNH
jgi:hypothetical protein